MTKLKHVDSDGWKPFKLDGAVFSDGCAEGLIGIEELTDYNLEKSNKKAKIVVTTNKSKKRSKSVSKWQCDDIEEKIINNKDIEPQKKKAKIKKSNTKSLSKFNKIISLYENEDNRIDHNESNIIDINVSAWSVLGTPNEIIKALSDQKFYTPTIIQSLTLAPAILGRRDILGAAETGSGKTLAFGIPILNGILELKNKHLKQKQDQLQNESDDEELEHSDDEDDSDKGENSDASERDLEENNANIDGIGCVRVIDNIKIEEKINSLAKPLYALILTPTRELAIQIKDHLVKAAKYTDIKIAVVVGGMAAVKQERLLSRGPEIVIATPGRLWELIQLGNVHLNQLNSIKYLAIDETDRMLEKGHFQELQDIIERINVNEKKSKERQTFVFSATLTLVHDIPDYLQRKKKRFGKSKIFKLTPGQKLQKIIDMLKIKNPKIVDITKETGTATNLTECRIACTIDHKDYYLYYFLKRHSGRTLVFCNSIGCVKRLATLFNILECNPLPLHANMQQRQRLKNLERFQADENGILIATDVAARGLDIPNVEHVIHYQVPRTSESYVHRSGRTARAQKEGITVLMMEPSEKQNYSKLCKTLGRTEDIPTFPVIDRLLIAVKERIDIAREIDSLELKCKRNNVHKGWLQKAVLDMDIILDEDQLETTMESKEIADLRRSLKTKRHHLASLLSKPLIPKGFSGKYPDTNTDYNLNQGYSKAIDIMKKVLEKNPKKTTKKIVGSLKRKRPIKKRKV
ncbi:ATP-dependent RNA helicase DDX24-like [Vespula squamosa]|uniref:ATP-dependent RNA helicase n=1 Tax=Vespula squamosa TaxID=30214 RepID=A0ABD2AAZ9_VESSQ